MSRCFLSYSHLNQHWVDKLLVDLKRLGIDARWDRSVLTAGDPWVRALESELAASDVLVLVVTPESMASQWVISERDGALALGRPIVPVVATRAVMPLFLRTTQHVDLSTGAAYPEGVRSLAARLLHVPVSNALPTETISPPDEPASRLPGSLIQAATELLAPACQSNDARYVLARRHLSLPDRDCDWIATLDDDRLAAQTLLMRALGNERHTTDQLKSVLLKVSERLDRERYQAVLRLLESTSPETGISRAERSYLEDRIRDWEKQPVQLLRDGRPMPEVKVTLHLGGGAELLAQPREVTGDPQPLAEYLVRFPRVQLWEVVGEPGSGKTTLMREMAANGAGRCLGDASGQVPVPYLFSAPTFQSTFADLLAKAHGPEVSNAFERRSGTGQVLLFLDGLDEVSPDVRGRLRREAHRLANAHQGNVIVFTSREIGFEHWPGWMRLDVLPLAPTEYTTLLANICGHERAAQIVAEIEPDERLVKLLSNPMTLTVLGAVALHRPELPRRRAELYRCAVHVLMEGRHGGSHQMPHSTLATDLLSRLALQLHLQGAGDVLDVAQIDRTLAELGVAWPAEWHTPEAFRRALADHTGLLQPTDVHQMRYRFLHRTFMEYFVAAALSEMVHGEQLSLIARLRDAPPIL